MYRKIKLFSAFAALLLTMCTFYDPAGAVVAPNGLSCQSQTDFGFFERQRSAQCYYQCPDGTVRQPEINGEFTSSSPLYSASKKDLDTQFCNGVLPPTPTLPTAEADQTLAVTETAAPTEIDSPTATEEVSVTATEAISITATEQLSITEQPPLVENKVTMCDLAADLINFRMLEPAPDLTGKTVMAEINAQETSCAINPVNTSLLTCNLPAAVTFPARIILYVDQDVVNDFTFNGLGCGDITTPISTTTP
jgi:hypothetical protein